jgi:galactokinase
MNHELDGMDLLFSSNVPSAAGLSSSASIEMAMAVAANSMFNLGIDQVSLVRLSQAAENNFVGVKCGIMDQYAVGMGRKGKAFVLDCKTISHHYVSADLKGYSLLVINTNKQRGLADSKYNERRSECEQGLSSLQKVLTGKSCLGDVSVAEFEAYKDVIESRIVRKRVQHVIYEDARVAAAMKSYAEGNAHEVARQLTASHESLCNLYEVTGTELDAIYQVGMASPGVLAIRMTGAGFGGCAIAYVETASLENFKENVRNKYLQAIGYEPSFYNIELDDGAEEVML